MGTSTEPTGQVCTQAEIPSEQTRSHQVSPIRPWSGNYRGKVKPATLWALAGVCWVWQTSHPITSAPFFRNATLTKPTTRPNAVREVFATMPDVSVCQVWPVYGCFTGRKCTAHLQTAPV